ncbi:RHS repeat protein, partial [Flaviaesturariibacter flavus]
MRYFILGLLLMVCRFSAIAGEVPVVVGRLQGSAGQLRKDSVCLAEDVRHFSSAFDGKVVRGYKVVNRVSLRIDEGAAYYFPAAFTASLQVRIYKTGMDTTQLDSVDKVLTINYTDSGRYSGSFSTVFNDAYRVRVKVLSDSISVGPAIARYLVLENELQAYPQFVFHCTNNAVQSISYTTPSSGAPDELLVQWPSQDAADEYDLEWAYIDSSALASGRYGTPSAPDAALLFAGNATRVTLGGTSYRIPLIYDNKGHLFFRVRSVQQAAGSSHRIEATWSSAFSGGTGRFDFNGHERELNWQATTSFAEEGKRKTVVQYFDGSLRSRQTVTKDNSSGTTVVAESFYDYQGRPIIQVLPAPTLNTVIGYTRNFNRQLNGSQYDKDNFDYLPDPATYCGSGADRLNDSSGTAQYYSPLNLDLSGFNQYIPDAEGYPFTEVEYTQDNIGRISRQSGVGKNFRLGSGHETKYYYGSPAQEELDALFGTEVGHFSHYFKTMVRDANGQYSVSYTDMHGRTIATALAGTPPDSIGLQKLTSNVADSITERLADASSAIIRDLTMESKKSLLVPVAGNHVFTYSLDPRHLQLNACDSTPVCYSCLYDLQITITDDCNNQKVHFDTTIRNFSIDSISASCDSLHPGFYYQFSRFLPEGNYEITKKLSISRPAMEYYRDSIFLVKNQCKTLEQFINEERAAVAQALDCAPSCQSCTDSLGTWETYRARFMIRTGVAPADSASLRATALSAYQQAKEACEELCGTGGVNVLEATRKAMLLDLTPPSGQYANLDSALTGTAFNIFRPTPDSAAYKKVSGYLDEEGHPDIVYSESAGAFMPPQRLDGPAFASKFKQSWAETLLPLHPEYCKLEYQNPLSASFEWDLQFEKVETYAEARQKGFLVPTIANGPSLDTPYSRFAAPIGVSTIPDPIIEFGTYKTDLESKIVNYFTATLPGGVPVRISMWSFATALSRCTGRDSSCILQYTSYDSAFNTSICSGDMDMAWRNFRSFYLKTKRDLIAAKTNATCPTPTPQSIVALYRTPNFGDAVSMNAAYGATLNDTRSGATAQVSGQLTNSYQDNCRAYAVQWLEQLRPCNFTTADTAIIIPRLVKVCAEGSDIAHPYGSSSVRPASSYRFRSFEDVLRQYSDSTGKPYNATCNAYLITAPAPYDKGPAWSNLPLYTKPDSCLCAKVSAYNVEYQAAGIDASFSAFMLRKTGTNIRAAVLDSLLSLCSGTITCAYLPSPLILPPALQCNVSEVCTDCLSFKDHLDQYRREFPGNMPAALTDVLDSVQIRKNKLFANFMNGRLGFTKTVADYLAFLDTCRLNTVNGDTLWSRIRDFHFYYRNAPARYENAAISPTTYEFIRSVNALLRNARNEQQPPEYARVDRSFQWEGKFRSMAPGYNNYWLVMMPVPLRYSFENMLDTSSIQNQIPYSRDFIGGASEPQLREKYVSVSMAKDNYSFSNFISWKYRTYFMDQNRSNPSAKYVPYQGSPGEIHGQTLAFFRIPASVTDTTTFANFYDLGVYKGNNKYDTQYLYRVDSILYVKSIGFDTRFIFRRELTDPNFYSSYLRKSTRGIKAVLKMIDGSEESAYIYAGYSGQNHFIYKTFVDSNLYHPDCKTAFTYFFNKRAGTTLTQAQVEALYVSAGVPRAYCYPDAIPQLCGKNEPLFPEVDLNDVTNCSDSSFFSVSGGTEKYRVYADSLRSYFDSAYRARCLEAYRYESFTVRHAFNEYHYTLYYYDQAGNLVKTLAPQGVAPALRQGFLDSVRLLRAAGGVLRPAHTQPTQYRYNTLNQVVAQQSPDGGRSEFWYDRLGRLSLSQNARQRPDSNYSYTLYDQLGRITEVGQLRQGRLMDDSISRRPDSLTFWITQAAVTKEQITRTVYDVPYAGWSGVSEAPITQHHLRNRVAYTTYSDGNNPDQYNSATFYTYDVHGNVDTLLQDYGNSLVSSLANVMNTTANRFKQVTYQYDLISGKVNRVAYQEGRADQLLHRYYYDAENRLTEVETSLDGLTWDRDARYSYYKHGPLARTVLGGQSVQGVDYAYTLQGWLKGVNGSSLRPAYDLGGDGLPGGPAQYTGRDAYSFSLNYHAGDYKAIGGTTPFPGTSAYLGTSGFRPLYNGNISSMAVNIGALSSPMLYSYTYDQLNRITGMDAYTGLNSDGNNWSALSLSTNYQERVRYDANGNILGYLRNGTTAGGKPLAMDSLTYHYLAGTNQLGRVRDNVPATNYDKDIDDQPVANYAYDPIGNLVKDSLEGIRRIEWTVYGKIKAVHKGGDTTITYRYDASGNRIAKTVIPGAGTPKTTWYVRDAQGNVMAVYSDSSDRVLLKEQHLYGSSRLGIRERVGVTTGTGEAVFDPGAIAYLRGEKRYELSNHLGNVLVTISDRKYGVDTSGDGESDRFIADVLSAQDYYPFGMQMPGKAFAAGTS